MNYEAAREAATKRIKAKREFRTNVITYLVINAFLVGIWAISGAGYFWPVWVMAGWGLGLILHGWRVYGVERPVSEEEIRREMGESG